MRSRLGVRGYLGAGLRLRPLGRRRARAAGARRRRGRTACASSTRRVEFDRSTRRRRATGSINAHPRAARDRDLHASSCCAGPREKARRDASCRWRRMPPTACIEFYETVREYRMTPIELLDGVEHAAARRSTSATATCIADNPRLNYSGARDLELMGAAGVSISHCPINIVRRARVLDNWQQVPEGWASTSRSARDTYPRDMIMNMRTASYHGKVMSHNSRRRPPRTCSRGDAERREIARPRRSRPARARRPRGHHPASISPGAARCAMGRCAIRSSSVVECGVGDDVDTVIVEWNRAHERRQDSRARPR